MTSLRSLFDLPVTRPRTTLFAVLFAVAAALACWPAVRFQPDVSRLLPADHPHVRIAELLDASERPARSLWILVAGESLETEVPRLAQALRASPLVDSVASTRDELFGEPMLAALTAPLWSLDEAGLQRLQEALSPTGRARAIEALRQDLADDPLAGSQLAVRDPLGVRWLFDDPARRFGLEPGTGLAVLAGGGQALLRLVGTADAYDADFAQALLEHVERSLAGVDHRLFGGYAVARGDAQRLRGDFERSSIWAFAAIALYLCWVMRGVRLPLIVQAPAALSVACAIPIGNLLFGPLPTVAVAAVAVLCGLGVDFAIHYAARYREARLQLGHGDAVRTVQRAIAPELLIDMATTAVTFLAVGFGQQGGLRTFGLLLALGLVISVVLTLMLLPILLAYAGHRQDPERSLLSGLADRWLAQRASRAVALCVAAVAVIAAAFAIMRGVPVDADPASLRPADDPVAEARRHIERQIGFSTVPVVVLLPANAEPSGQLAGLEAMRDAGTIRFWSGLDNVDTAAGRDGVAAFRAATAGFAEATLRELAAAGFAPEPFRPALVELATRLAADPPAKAPLWLDIGGDTWRAVTVWPSRWLEGDQFAAFQQQVRSAIGADAQVHGGPTVAQSLEAMLRQDLGRACLLAVVLGCLLVRLWQRSYRRALLALLPSVIGTSLLLVLLPVAGLSLTLVSFVAVPFVLGIGVDEGVHTVGHFRHGARTTGATGVGVVRTSLGTVLGFSSLLLADSPGLAQLGGLVAAGSLLCMLACLFVLAPLLRVRSRGAAGD